MLENNILAQGLEILKEKQRLSTESYNDMVSYLGKVDKSQYKEFKYSDFNKVNSISLTFSDFDRTITNGTIGDLYLYTSAVNLNNTILKGIVFNDEEKREVSFSLNGTDYVKMNTYNAHEIINTNTVYFKIKIEASAVITGFYLIYDLV